MARKKLPTGIYWRGKILWITYRDGSGNQIRVSTGGDSVGAAQVLLRKAKTDIQEGKRPILKKREKMQFKVFASEYLGEYEGKKSYHFRKLIIEKLKTFFGKYNLDEIDLLLVKQYKKQRLNEQALNRNKKISPATVNRELSIMRHALNIAVENRRLQFSPLVKQSKLYEKEHERQRIFTNEEIGALIAGAQLPLKWFIILAINTGMREGEIMGLRWSEIDLTRRTITLTAQRTKGDRTRTIPMSEEVHALLSERKLQRGTDDKAEGREYVFPNPSTGQPYKWISHSWALLLDKCKINPPGRFHDLRHTTATNWAAAGVPQADIRDLLGHKYSSTTDRYMAGTDARKKDAVRLVHFGEPAGELEEMPKRRAR